MTKYFFIRAESGNTLDAKGRNLLKRLVNSGKLDSSVLADELRAHRGEPIACVAYTCDGTSVKYAVSTHYPTDEFKRKRAREVASARLNLSPLQVTVAQSGASAIMHDILLQVESNKSFSSRTRKAASYMLETYSWSE